MQKIIMYAIRGMVGVICAILYTSGFMMVCDYRDTLPHAGTPEDPIWEVILWFISTPVVVLGMYMVVADGIKWIAKQL